MLKKMSFIFGLMFISTGAYAAGSLAIDSGQGSGYGWADNFTTSSQADQYALNQCGGNCQVVQRFSRQCAAYAADQSSGSTVYGWATASTSSAAQNRAMNECSNRGGTNCITRVWGCDNR